jgi:hypothetical protein
MPIIRGAHDFDESFTRLPNRWLRDERLSLKAIGLMAQLHSHSVGWRLSVRSLAEANKCGLDLIRNAIAELESAGYLRRDQARGENNQFSESVWTTVDPSSGYPCTAFPSSEKAMTKKNNIKKIKEKKHMPDLVRFDEFWESYPRRVGKTSALRAYTAARGRYAGSAGDFEAMVISGAIRLSQDRNLPALQYVPYPTTWLNRDGWNDDPYPERQMTQDEIRERQRLASATAIQRDKANTQKILSEPAPTPEPIPLCEHGEKLVYCKKCLKRSAKVASDG